MTTPTKHNRDGLLAVFSFFWEELRLKQCYAAKASITFSLSNSCVRSFSMASMATLWSYSFDIEFLTHVFMCHRQEKLRSHAAVLTGNAIAITPIFYSSGNASLYHSRQEINANILLGFSTESNRSISRFAWWSSWLKSVSLANGFKAVKSANFTLVGLRAWMPINTLQWLSEAAFDFTEQTGQDRTTNVNFKSFLGGYICMVCHRQF